MVSRMRWLVLIGTWALSETGRTQLRAKKLRVRTFLQVTGAFAKHCDGSTGRWIAVTNATIANDAGVCTKIVTTVRRLLADNDWAIEARRGCGRADGRYNRPSVWHLTTPRPLINATDSAPLDHAVFHPLRSSSLKKQSSVQTSHQDAPTRARRKSRSNDQQPLPLVAHKLADGLLARTVGLATGHIGAIVRALAESHLDLSAWTADDLRDGLEETNGGWDWPAGRIRKPGAFLAHRLRKLPSRPHQLPSRQHRASGPAPYTRPGPAPVTGAEARTGRAAIRAILTQSAAKRLPTNPFEPTGRTFSYAQ